MSTTPGDEPSRREFLIRSSALLLASAVSGASLGGEARVGGKESAMPDAPGGQRRRGGAEEAHPAGPPPAPPPPDKKALPTGFLSAALYKEHQTGASHPEAPERIDAVVKAVQAKPLGEKLVALKARAATEEEILSCHKAAYLAQVKEDFKAGQNHLSTDPGDTTICRDSFRVALHAAGGVLAAVDAVFEGRVANAFCAVRPPGHHACPARGMGFCLFNNVAIAARYAQRKHKAEKVLIADWDVHHGNGTQEVFYEDGTVFFFSTHQWPWYPGTGRREETGQGKGLGLIMNRPFPAGSGRKEILGAFQDDLAPAARKFKPDLVLISAGFDSRKDDPLGNFTLTDEDFADLTGVMLGLARECAQGRLVSVLEGGYNLDGLARASAAHIHALQGEAKG